jgi:hypothetical protein
MPVIFVVIEETVGGQPCVNLKIVPEKKNMRTM